MSLNKKFRERIIITEVKNLFRGFPKGEIFNFEGPDFLIRNENIIIGIEVVDYIRGQGKGKNSDRKIESDQQKILDLAQNIFESKYDILLLVSPFWNFRKYPCYKEFELIAHSLIDLISENIPTQIHKSTKIDNSVVQNTPLESYCSWISLMRMEGQSRWRSFEAGFISLAIKEIQYLMSLKAQKYQKYIMNCDSLWLLIVADGKHISSTIDPLEVLSVHFYSPFEKILLYAREEKIVYSLNNVLSIQP